MTSTLFYFTMAWRTFAKKLPLPDSFLYFNGMKDICEKLPFTWFYSLFQWHEEHLRKNCHFLILFSISTWHEGHLRIRCHFYTSLTFAQDPGIINFILFQQDLFFFKFQSSISRSTFIQWSILILINCLLKLKTNFLD